MWVLGTNVVLNSVSSQVNLPFWMEICFKMQDAKGGGLPFFQGSLFSSGSKQLSSFRKFLKLTRSTKTLPPRVFLSS